PGVLPGDGAGQGPGPAADRRDPRPGLGARPEPAGAPGRVAARRPQRAGYRRPGVAPRPGPGLVAPAVPAPDRGQPAPPETSPGLGLGHSTRLTTGQGAVADRPSARPYERVGRLAATEPTGRRMDVRFRECDVGAAGLVTPNPSGDANACSIVDARHGGN